MERALIAAAIVCTTQVPAFASECEDLPSSGQASVEKKYLKIKAESADANTDCAITRQDNTAVVKGYHVITVYCRIHFRPRNGGCLASVSPGSIVNTSRPVVGCEDQWAWLKMTGLNTAGDNTAENVPGKEFTGTIRFDMIKEQYELKYKVLAGEKTSDKLLNNAYKATLKQICMRKY